jgi:hypothetical protein
MGITPEGGEVAMSQPAPEFEDWDETGTRPEEYRYYKGFASEDSDSEKLDDIRELLYILVLQQDAAFEQQSGSDTDSQQRWTLNLLARLRKHRMVKRPTDHRGRPI